MEDDARDSQEEAIDVRQLAQAIRFALVVIIVGLSYIGVRLSFGIDNFSRIYADMLGGRPLPMLTGWILHARHSFVASSLLVPIIAIGTLFLRRIVASFYILGALALILIFQCITLYTGLTLPLFDIIKSMGASE